MGKLRAGETDREQQAAREPTVRHSRRVLVNRFVSCTASDRLFGTSIQIRLYRVECDSAGTVPFLYFAKQ